MRCGWVEEATELAKMSLELVGKDAFTDAGSTIAIKETTKLILELMIDQLKPGISLSTRQPIDSDQEIAFAREHAMSTDIDDVSQALTGLLNRHTYHTRSNTKKREYDFWNWYYAYDPYEVLSLIHI